MKIHIDFETYSEVDLKSAGLVAYATHPSTEVLMMSYAIDDQEVHLWLPWMGPFPDVVCQADEVHAFNAAFEEAILQHVLHIETNQIAFRCTMVKAYGLSFTGGLDKIMQQIGFSEDKRKLQEGRRLILKFCKPQPTNRKLRRHTPWSDPTDWALFEDYCRQDTVAERELSLWLDQYNPMSEVEWRIWRLDQKINNTGVPIDIDYIDAALHLHREAKSQIKSKLKEITHLDNPLSNKQMMGYLAATGIPLKNLQVATVVKAIERSHPAAAVLQDYSRAVATAPTKYKAFKSRDVGSRVYGMFQFAGASRTRRWAGRGVQLQNLKRGNLDTVTVQAILDGRLDLLTLFGDPMDLLAKGVRSSIKASPGTQLVVSDLGSIESRVLGWISGCTRINEIFAQGLDTYKDMATGLFHVEYDQVTKAQRTFAKPPVLGAGYGLGAKGMLNYAEAMGVKMDLTEATHAVDTFRAQYYEVPQMWWYIKDMLEHTLLTGEATTHAHFSFSLSPDRKFMWITLPSGRRLAYYQPLWQDHQAPFGIVKAFTYMGIDRYTLKWSRIAAHHGLITENLCQAIARDVLAAWMLRAEQEGFTLVGHVHDEIICEEKEDRVEELNELSRKPIPWAEGLLLDADGYTAQRYRK